MSSDHEPRGSFGSHDPLVPEDDVIAVDHRMVPLEVFIDREILPFQLIRNRFGLKTFNGARSGLALWHRSFAAGSGLNESGSEFIQSHNLPMPQGSRQSCSPAMPLPI